MSSTNLCHCERGTAERGNPVAEKTRLLRRSAPRKDSQKVFIALSGGVDSSVSLYLLQKAGYDCTAVFIKIGEHIERADGDVGVDKCWIGERREAMRVAAYLNVPFLTFDFDKEYKKEVLNYFFREYKAGRTPNPDVMCNRRIKFPLFWKKAKALGADFMATGHYARTSLCHSRPVSRYGVNCSGNPVHKLLAGKDRNKDQSYFLYNLTSKDLEHILFPIGHLTKPEVRVIAKEAGLPTAEKKESQGLCFIGEVNIKQFLKTKIKPKKGKIVDADRGVIGEHDGLFYYTIGQRHGLNIKTGGGPYFVVGKNIKKNELAVATIKDEKKFYKKELEIHDGSWVSSVRLPIKCQARIRYRAPLAPCEIISQVKSGSYVIKFSKPQRAVTPGQSIVFYKGNEVLGGGIIQ